MTRISSFWSGLEREDQYMFLSSVLAPIVVWWLLIGRKRYSTKGMK